MGTHVSDLDIWEVLINEILGKVRLGDDARGTPKGDVLCATVYRSLKLGGNFWTGCVDWGSSAHR